VKSPRTGKRFALIQPSRRALAEIQAEIKALTCRRNLGLPKEMVLQRLNELVRGWVGYFYYGNCSRNLSQVKRYLEERVRIYLRRRRGKGNRGYKQYPTSYLYTTLHLYRIPTTAPWTQAAKAFGRR
jgi:RNA-directed DNA polymerase